MAKPSAIMMRRFASASGMFIGTHTISAPLRMAFVAAARALPDLDLELFTCKSLNSPEHIPTTRSIPRSWSSYRVPRRTLFTPWHWRASMATRRSVYSPRAVPINPCSERLNFGSKTSFLMASSSRVRILSCGLTEPRCHPREEVRAKLAAVPWTWDARIAPRPMHDTHEGAQAGMRCPLLTLASAHAKLQ